MRKIRISFAICMLFLVACDNDDPVKSVKIDFAEVTALELKVDQADFTGTCPHTFKLTGTITTSGAGRVHYRFTDFDFWLANGIVDFTSAGTKTVTADLVYPQSAEGAVILDIPRQNFLSSNTIPLFLSCR